MEGVTRNARALPAVKWIFDPSFHYHPSYATDVRKTFERIRREMQALREPLPSRKITEEKILRLDARKSGASSGYGITGG